MFVIALIFFAIFGFNMGLDGTWTEKVETLLGIAVFVSLISTFVVHGALCGIGTLIVGIIATKLAYSFSPKLR